MLIDKKRYAEMESQGRYLFPLTVWTGTKWVDHDAWLIKDALPPVNPAPLSHHHLPKTQHQASASFKKSYEKFQGRVVNYSNKIKTLETLNE
jgi:hypothetical protein